MKNICQRIIQGVIYCSCPHVDRDAHLCASVDRHVTSKCAREAQAAFVMVLVVTTANHIMDHGGDLTGFCLTTRVVDLPIS